jgi:catechol 2,3-dioxygenase-like lactoylglutathione lyase family enzyme
MTTTLGCSVSHLSLGTNDLEAAVRFYDRVLATLGIRRMMTGDGHAVYGREFPEFTIGTPIDGGRATVGNGTHVGFNAPTREAVHAFHAAALEAGGADEGAPGPRPAYGPAYHGGFARDLDGHKIEASYWDVDLAMKIHGEQQE